MVGTAELLPCEGGRAMNEDEGEEWVEDGREEGHDDGRALMAAASCPLTSCKWRSNVSSTYRDEHKT